MSNKRLMLSWLPAVAGMAALFYSSSLPGNEIDLPPFLFSDKLVHFLAYSGLGGLISLRHRLQLRLPKGPDLAGMAVGMLFGVSDEIHQLFVPLRQFAVSDLAADFLGVAAAIWIYGRIFKPAARPAVEGG